MENKNESASHPPSAKGGDQTGGEILVVFRAFNTKTGEEIRTPIYIDNEGNAYKDADPYGIQMNASRKISPAPDVRIEMQSPNTPSK